MKNEEFIYLPEVVSTNDALALIVRERKNYSLDLEDVIVLYADWQSGGKGMAGNVWESNPKENILASFYFFPSVSPSEQFFVNIFFSLSVRRMLSKYLYPVKIKWPNDIYVNDKKIGGILIEHTVQGEKLDSIAGIGLNLNQTEFSASLPNPTSVKLETGFENGRVTLIKELYWILKTYINLLKTKDFERLKREYYWHLYRYQEFHPYNVRGENVMAQIIGIDDFGQLQLETDDGKVLSCGFKEVKQL